MWPFPTVVTSMTFLINKKGRIRRGNIAEQFSFQLIFFSLSSCLVLFLSHSSVSVHGKKTEKENILNGRNYFKFMSSIQQAHKQGKNFTLVTKKKMPLNSR